MNKTLKASRAVRQYVAQGIIAHAACLFNEQTRLNPLMDADSEFWISALEMFETLKITPTDLAAAFAEWECFYNDTAYVKDLKANFKSALKHGQLTDLANAI